MTDVSNCVKEQKLKLLRGGGGGRNGRINLLPSYFLANFSLLFGAISLSSLLLV